MDVILHYADEYLLDRVWATVLPANPTSVLLKHSPSLLASFLQDDQTQNYLAAQAASSSALSAATAAAASSGGGGGQGAYFVTNLTSTLLRAATGGVFSASAVSASTSASSTALAAVASQVAAASASTGSASSAWQAAADLLDWPTLSHLSALPRSNLIRQAISLYAITYAGILLLYFTFAWASFHFLFNKSMMKHPRFLKNQINLEINSSLAAFPVLDLLTLPWFLFEVRGASKLYTSMADGPWANTWFGLSGWTYGLLVSVPFFLLFTDACIYFVHRIEHHPRLYKHIHKPHHRWIIPTPFASHAFHPLDGYAQSLPYHIFVYLFPLHRAVYMGLFVFVNLWSILIHDSDMICNSPLEKVINGPSHHTLHHLYFTVNYGQYFTGCDRLGGSYRAPKMEDDPLLEIERLQKLKGSKADAEAVQAKKDL